MTTLIKEEHRKENSTKFNNMQSNKGIIYEKQMLYIVYFVNFSMKTAIAKKKRKHNVTLHMENSNKKMKDI